MIWGSSAAQRYHMRWFQAHMDPGVTIRRLGQTLNGLMVAGPKSREVLAELVDEDVSNDAFRFMDSRAMDVDGCPARVNRISYTGELGYEIWTEPTYLRRLYRGIKRVAKKVAPLAKVDFGMRALLAMRLEKNWPTWGWELRPIYGAYEGDMGRFVKLAKNDFIGRAAAAQEKEAGPRLRRVSFEIDAATADVMRDEPVWARLGDEDPGTVDAAHGIGVPRRLADCTEVPQDENSRDGDWRVVGWVTSGGYGHYVEKSLAQAYVPASLATRDDAGLFEIEILGERYPARILIDPPHDPMGVRMRDS